MYVKSLSSDVDGVIYKNEVGILLGGLSDCEELVGSYSQEKIGYSL